MLRSSVVCMRSAFRMGNFEIGSRKAGSKQCVCNMYDNGGLGGCAIYLLSVVEGAASVCGVVVVVVVFDFLSDPLMRLSNPLR